MASNAAWFRKLSSDETTQFQTWARENYHAGDPINPVWHPVVRAECEKMNVEAVETRPSLYDDDYEPPKTPIVGMGVTYHIGCDEYAYTVVEVIAPKTIVVQQDRYHRGLFIRDEKGQKVTVTLRKQGYWVERGKDRRHGRFVLGQRRHDLPREF